MVTHGLPRHRSWPISGPRVHGLKPPKPGNLATGSISRGEPLMTAMDNAYALVIGIADYRCIRKLPQVHDAQDIAALLTDPTRCGYPKGNVELLLDGQAT